LEVKGAENIRFELRIFLLEAFLFIIESDKKPFSERLFVPTLFYVKIILEDEKIKMVFSYLLLIISSQLASK